MSGRYVTHLRAPGSLTACGRDARTNARPNIATTARPREVDCAMCLRVMKPALKVQT